MTHSKSVIFMILPLLFVPLVYGMSSTPDACAVPHDPNYSVEDCTTEGSIPGVVKTTCCWTERERVPGQILAKEVKYCQTCATDGKRSDCNPKVAQMTTPPTTGENVVPGGGVAEQPEQSPLFGGQNDAGVPPTGGVEQPPTTTTQPTPGGGAGAPTQGGSAEQPTAPQDNQDDTQGGLPPIKNQENVPPGGGVAEQPEEDNGQEDSSEGAPTAGPLT
jgi:hypothetical protein